MNAADFSRSIMATLRLAAQDLQTCSASQCCKFAGPANLVPACCINELFLKLQGHSKS